MTKTESTLHIIAAACDNMGIGHKGSLPWKLQKEMKFFSDKTSTTDSEVDFYCAGSSMSKVDVSGPKNSITASVEMTDIVTEYQEHLRNHCVRDSLWKRFGPPGKKNAVIMGRNTWFAIPEKFRPLPKRINVVLSTTIAELPGAQFVASSFDTALDWLHSPAISPIVDKIFVIGGETVYKIAMDSDHKQRIYLTRIQNEFECDVFFPTIDENKYKLAEKQDVPEGIQEENGITYKHEVYEKH